MLQKEHHVELPVAVAIVREHRVNLEMHLREDGTTRITVDLPILDSAPDVVPATRDGEETFEQALAGSGGGPPPAPKRARGPARAAPKLVAASKAAAPKAVAPKAVAPPVAAPEAAPAATPDASGSFAAMAELTSAGPPKE